MMKRKILAITLIATTIMSLVGCSGGFFDDVTEYPLVNRMTEQEIIDFYAEGLKYDSVITKNLDIQQTEYVEKEVDGDKKTQLLGLQQDAESILGLEDYDDNVLVSEDTYHYIKSYLNGNTLNSGNVVSVTGALGYYFVDVKYTLSAGEIGKLLPSASLLGINGAFVKDAYGEDKLDTAFLTAAVNKLNSHYETNKLNKTIEFDEASGTFVVTDESSDISGATTYVPSTSEDRICTIDVDLFNKVVGSSYKSVAYTPDLSLVFEKPGVSGTISGIGMFPSGGCGLKLFGYNRDNITGECTLRYVFKDTVDGSGSIVGVNVYPKAEIITTGFNISDSNVKIPEFLMTEFEKLLERADRATISNIVAALTDGSIYEDMGFGLLRGYEYSYVNLLKNMSVIRQVIARDTKNNAYLLEIESTRTEGPADVDCYGTYRDKSYIVVQQRGKDFVITDQIRLSRTLVSEPPVNPDSSVEKRLVALNFSGDVSKEQQNEINKLLKDWYIAGSVRTLRVTDENKEVKYNGEKITLNRGMYDCFNSDVKMVSTDYVEYVNSGVRGLLTKFGTGVDCNYNGTVTQWIGGHENQAEFTTEELFTYNRKNEAVYQEVYYLVSKMGDNWVIDERTVISEKTIEGSDIETVKSRINS